MKYQLNPLLETFLGIDTPKNIIDKSNKIRKHADFTYGKAKWLTPLKNRKNFKKAAKELRDRGEI